MYFNPEIFNLCSAPAHDRAVPRRDRARQHDFARVKPFIDQATILYAADGDTYLAWLADEGKSFLLGEWSSESGTQLYSIITHVPNTLGCVEIVTNYVDASYLDRALKMNHVRLPD